MSETTRTVVTLCPLNRMRPCLAGCAWSVNGKECAVHMLSQEMYLVVEAMRAGSAPLPILEGEGQAGEA